MAPRIVNGRIMVPLRAIFEEMGADVSWDNESRTVTATKDSLKIVMTIDDPMVRVNDSALRYGSQYGMSLDQPAIIVDGRALAPLRYVAEAFGGAAIWNGETRTAYITKGAKA